jgi:transposase
VIIDRLRLHADRQVFVHLPKAGHGVRAARLLAEIGDVRTRFPDGEALAALAGVAPVTPSVRQSPVGRLPLGLR